MRATATKTIILRHPRGAGARLGAALLAVVAAAASSCDNSLGSDNSSRTPGQPATILTVPLTYREITNKIFVDDLLFRDVLVRPGTNPFPKEPLLGSDRVIRGVLRFGSSSSNAVSFLWQTAARKLYLDLNRNEDLTDDAPGPFSGRPTGPQASWIVHQVFTNIHLTFPSTSAGAPLMVDLNCIQVGQSNVPMVNVMARSYWQGKVTVAGREWEVGLLQNLSDQPGSFRRGQMLLRPWVEHDKLFSGWSDPTEAWALPFEYRCRVLKAADAFEFSPRVFFEGHAWEVDWGAEPATCEGSFAVGFSEQHAALGQLQFAGRFVERVVMTGGPYAVVLVRPGSSVQVPVGSYYQPSLWLKQGRDVAYFNSLPRSGEPTVPDPRLGGVRPLSGVVEAGECVGVDGQKPAVLVMGGPLTNALVVSRHGRELKLKHHLVGAGGGEYKLWEYWRTKGDVPPRFAVYKGDKKLASDKFEFG